MPYYRVVTIATGIAIGLLLRFPALPHAAGHHHAAVVDKPGPDRPERGAAGVGHHYGVGARVPRWPRWPASSLSEELSALDPSTLTLFIVDAFAAAIIAGCAACPWPTSAA